MLTERLELGVAAGDPVGGDGGETAAGLGGLEAEPGLLGGREEEAGAAHVHPTVVGLAPVRLVEPVMSEGPGIEKTVPWPTTSSNCL